VGLTERQAYDAMFLFLLEFWERGGRTSGDIAELLSWLDRSTTIWADDGSADPAMEDDWAKSVARIKSGFDPYPNFAKPS
jgi:hypothetical protein